MDHLEEYKEYGTCSGYTLEEASDKENVDIHWSVLLQFKDVDGKASKEEQVVLKLQSFFGFNNIDYITQEEILELSKELIHFIK